MKLLYFAWLRQRVGVAEENLQPPPEIGTVRQLIAWLTVRGENYAEAFKDLKRVRAAVNQEHVSFDHPVSAGDEVAFFPPVTGGSREDAPGAAPGDPS